VGLKLDWAEKGGRKRKRKRISFLFLEFIFGER
jgi:hypothetical protein